MMKKDILLVITNNVQAKIYQVTGHSYTLTQEINHPRGRLKTSQLGNDKPGHYKTCHSSHGEFSSSDSHEEEHIYFAKIVADFMMKATNENHNQRIILCAAPHFYGLINQHLPQSTKNLTLKVIGKDYIPLPEPKLNAVIKSIINEPF